MPDSPVPPAHVPASAVFVSFGVQAARDACADFLNECAARVANGEFASFTLQSWVGDQLVTVTLPSGVVEA